MTLTVALFWSAALFVVAARMPVYGETTETPSGRVIERHSATLVEENGSGILPIIGVPMLVGLSLWGRGTRRGAGPIAWTFAGLLAGANLLAMLTIGPLIVPVTVCLVVACALHDSATRPTPPASR